jgi:gliding motility-associated-like protein
MKNNFFHIILFFLSLSSFSQTLEDSKKKYPIRNVIKKNNIALSTSINTDFNYNFCDDDDDGIMTIDLTSILDEVQVAVSGDLQVADPKLLIGTSDEKLLEIDNILQNPITTVLCELPDNTYDVAMNSSLQFYTTNYNSIDYVDDLTCQLTSQLNMGGNSLSFDTQDNLYFNALGAGTASTSAVYRLDSGSGATPYIWHDFNSGTAGGDFVIYGNFMYIAWKFNEDVLLKVTIDDDINYVSHEVLGPLKFNTFGLASEQGVLYGITEGEIYKINLSTSPPSFETILQNDYTHGAWYGSAGFSEAIAFSSSAYSSQLDADNNDNPLPNPWTNTTSGEQTIYIRTEEVSEVSNYTVTPVTITISPTPSVATTPPNLETCDFDGNGIELFDLTPQTSLILGAQDSSQFEVIYSTESTFTNLITTPQNYTCTSPLETIFFRIINSNESTCFAEGEFNLTFTDEVNCVQNEPPVLSADSREAYCPLSQIKIAENFTITDPDDTGLDFFTVQISSGYSSSDDLLELTGSHPTISTTWNVTEGKLILEPNAPASQILYEDLQTAVREIVFSSTDANISGEKFFSLTIGDGNYLPSTEHFYVYKENIGITWSEAKDLAELSSYFGLQGYLVTIFSEEENIISAEQISGTGWIGASDEGTEGVWNWVTGPEAGTNFWNGNFTGGPAGGLYSNWNTNEPNQSGDEDYAHITDNSVGIPGSWNDLPNAGGGGPYEPKGYIVEYGGMPGDPPLNISASTSIYIPEITGTTNDRTCTGGSVSLSATVTEGEIYWYDALVDGNLVFTGDTFITPLLTSSTTYYVAASPEGCATSGRIAVEAIVDTTPVFIPSPLDINRCDEDRSGFVDFDLIADQTPEILNSLDPILNPDLTDFEVLYFDTLVDAEANNTAAIISNPYPVNTSDNPTIYARIHNINNTTCYTIVEFKLKVTDTPTPTQPSVYRLCDDAASGSDIDQKSLFLLNTKDAEILASVVNPGDYFISYHTDLLDAQTSSTSNAIDKNTDYEVTISQRIYVRIENIDNVACNTVSDDSPGSTFTSFELIVDPLPIITDTVELKQCDDDTDGFSLFNLNEAATDISTNFANETFVFYPTLADAENDTNAFTAAEALIFENRTVTTDVVWARAISSENCYRIAQVDIIVSTTGLPASFERSFSVCDDFLDIDGNDTANNDDNDGISAFDFSSVTAEVRALFPASQQLTITYYRNQADALAELNAIADPSNYRNIGYPVTQQIYIRVDSDLDNDCLGFGPYITLTVEPVTAQEVGDLELCDDLDDGDGFNGIVQTFNLASQTATILGTQDPLDFTVTYHNSAADALSGNAPIATPAMYENITPNLETIFVRVENNLSGCFTAQTSFDLIVNPLPVANFVADLEVCDDNTDGSAQNGFSQSFDLELQTAGILGTQDPAQFTVTYHASLADAQAGALPLGSPFSNSVPFSQIIYVRVYNSLTGCANGISNFNAIVNPEPTTENASNLSYCDDDLDGDDTNGFVQNIDLDSQITEILGPLQDPDDFNVTFHETQMDATDGTDALSSPYTNTLANQQTIYVRVENKDTQCVNDDFTFDVIVNPLPEFTVTSPQIVCLSGPDLTIFVENPAAVYDYVWTDPSGNEIIGSQITISSGGLYTVTATTTNGTECTRTREILVNESSVATITDADVTIVDDSENNSITIDPTNLGIGDYQYALINENGVQTTFQDLPFFENLQGGFYTIVVQDKNGCRPNATLLVSVIEFPKFFTPNNDGINDTWAIKGANSTFFPSAQINIFNRFGKIVAQIDIDTQGWDGTYGGKILASDDYWFSIMLVDRNGALRERKGNFSLLRR